MPSRRLAALVGDDEPLVRALIRAVFKDPGWEVTEPTVHRLERGANLPHSYEANALISTGQPDTSLTSKVA